MTQDRKTAPGSPGKRFREHIAIKYRPGLVVFANLITCRHRRPPAANTASFVKYVIGKKLAASQQTGFEGSLIYREPGRALHQSFYNWVVESVLSLTVNRLEQSFGVWLNQAYTLSMLSGRENRIHAVAPTQRVSLNQTARVPEPFEPLYRVERSLQTVYAGGVGRDATRDLRLPSFQTIRPWLDAARRGGVERESRTPVLGTQPRAFVRARQNGESWQPDPVTPGDRRWPRAGRGLYPTTPLARKALAEKIEAVYASRPFAGPGAANTTARAAGLASHDLQAARAQRGERGQEVSPWPGALINTGNRAGEGVALRSTGGESLKVGPSAGLIAINGDSFAQPLNRVMVTTTAQAYNTITGGASNELSFLRREGQLRPPLESYAFAQPVRSTVVEEQVVKRTQEKEVVEVVRKEVEKAMKSRSLIDGLSRSDYSRIADHVYSSLTRRLLMDKERRGLGF